MPWWLLQLVATLVLGLATSSVQAALVPLTQVVSVATGGEHSCALMNDQSVQCWGRGSDGQLGQATPGNSNLPLKIAGVSDVIAVTAGSRHTCALLSGGTVSCWGAYNLDRLTNGIWTADRGTPVAVVGVSSAIAVVAGHQHTCALLASGGVRCWGSNFYGQLGNGSTTGSNSAVTINSLPAAIAISAAGDHTCAILSGGTVACWGDNDSGQLGNGTTIESRVPVSVGGLTGVVALASGYSHTCALLGVGTVWCWGIGTDGELGGSPRWYANSAPVAVPGVSGATAIAAAGFHTCALIGGGTASCWGNNLGGQLGNGVFTDSSPPTAVVGLVNAAAIATGSSHTCAKLASGTVSCWGSNSDGQLGDGKATGSNRPVAVTGLNNAASIAAGTVHGCALVSDGTASCWGLNRSGQIGAGIAINAIGGPVAVPERIHATAITAGSDHTCVVLSNRTATCWGRNASGELGNGTTVDSSAPIPVAGLTSVTAISSGSGFGCALLDGGTVACWGNNSSGQLGNGTSVNSAVPVTAFGVSGAVAVAAGGDHACAVLGGGTVSCWGGNGSGQLGNGFAIDSHLPVSVSGLTEATAITAGYRRSCALLRSGRVSCWGSNVNAALGIGDDVPESYLPVAVNGIADARAIAAGSSHTCALLKDGTVWCWGSGSDGQIGTGAAVYVSPPVAVRGITGATAIASGLVHTCAVLIGGTVACWGNSNFGQLGNGMQGEYALPQTVVTSNQAATERTMVEYYFEPFNYYFTTSRDDEKVLLDGRTDWTRTGQSFTVLEANVENTKGLSRFYFDQIARNNGRGSHFYTLLDSEKALLRAQNPGNAALPRKPLDEGIDSYAYQPVIEGVRGSCAAGLEPVYRLFRGNAQFPDDPNHRFTIDITLYSGAVAQGWDGEGVKICVPLAP